MRHIANEYDYEIAIIYFQVNCLTQLKVIHISTILSHEMSHQTPIISLSY